MAASSLLKAIDSGQLDREPAQMRQEGADTLLLQADRLPLGNRKLWCSFQPDQLSAERRRLCDHVDVQL